MLAVFTVVSVVGTYRNLFAVVHLTLPLHKKSCFVFIRGGEAFLRELLALLSLIWNTAFCCLVNLQDLTCKYMQPFINHCSGWVLWGGAGELQLPHLINTLWGLGGNTSKYVAVFFNWHLMFIGSELHLWMLSTDLGHFASHVVTQASVACDCNPAAHLKADSQSRAGSCSICCWPQLVHRLSVLSSWCDVCSAAGLPGAWAGTFGECSGWFPELWVVPELWQRTLLRFSSAWAAVQQGAVVPRAVITCKLLSSAVGMEQVREGSTKDRNFLGGSVRWSGPSGRREWQYAVGCTQVEEGSVKQSVCI